MNRALLCASLLSAILLTTTWAFAQDDGSGALSDADETVSLQQLQEWADAYPADPEIAFALGLRYARQSEIGRATLYLERAHLLRPLERDVADALHTVRREARQRRAEAMPNVTITEGEPQALFWWRFFAALPQRSYAYGLLASLWVLFGLLALWRRMPGSGVRDAVLVSAIVAALGAGAAGAFWSGSAYTSSRLRPAVVTASDAYYHDAPDELSRRRRQPNLYEGAVALILEERDEWLHLELVDGETVWVRPSVATPVIR